MDFIGSIDQALPAIIELLRSIHNTPSKPLEFGRAEIVRKVWQAVDETKMFLASARCGEVDCDKPNPRLVTLWSEASLAIATIDDDLAKRLRMKAEYWSDPAYWTPEQVIKARITINTVAEETRRLLEPLSVAELTVKSFKADNQSIDVLLICALKDEFDQVLNVTNGIAAGWRSTNDSSGRMVADAELTALNGQKINIRATWAAHMGREATQALVSSIIQRTPAKCLAMSGICAGRRGKVELGDVIFGDRLWSYDAGKSVKENGHEVFQGDMLQYRPTEVWVQQMQAVSIPAGTPWVSMRPQLPYEHQEVWALHRLHAGENPVDHAEFEHACPDWAEVLKRLWLREWVVKSGIELTETGRKHISQIALLHPRGFPEPEPFQVLVAPLATGAAVKEDEEIFPRLSDSMRKVLGLDMEASGLAAMGEAHQVPVIVVKGVSDFGDKFKDDRYRSFAARASAEALFVLLRNTAHMILPVNAIAVPRSTSGLAPTSTVTSTPLPVDLIDILAELYPDTTSARSIWVRAGGSNRDVENIARPRDMWQRLWRQSCQGAVVKPQSLLAAVLEEYPGNETVTTHLIRLSA